MVPVSIVLTLIFFLPPIRVKIIASNWRLEIEISYQFSELYLRNSVVFSYSMVFSFVFIDVVIFWTEIFSWTNFCKFSPHGYVHILYMSYLTLHFLLLLIILFEFNPGSSAERENSAFQPNRCKKLNTLHLKSYIFYICITLCNLYTLYILYHYNKNNKNKNKLQQASLRRYPTRRTSMVAEIAQKR